MYMANVTMPPIESDPAEDASEFERLSLRAEGDSRGWKFNREELHER